MLSDKRDKAKNVWFYRLNTNSIVEFSPKCEDFEDKQRNHIKKKATFVKKYPCARGQGLKVRFYISENKLQQMR